MDTWFSAIIALFLPWLAGSAWTYWLLSRSSRWHPAAIIGHGYLLGLVATTMIMRGFHWAGLHQSFWGASLCLVFLTFAALGLLYLKPARARFRTEELALPVWQKAVIALLLGLIALRYATIFQELILRPLFPWDAWMNWAPKAIVWFHYSDLMPFRSQAEWLAAPADALVHLEGAKNAWKYPVAVPLVQLWGMLAVGTSQSTLPYLPWGIIAICLVAIMYGHLRLRGMPPLAACLAAYIIANLPFINVHSALSGYADLWVAVYFSAAVLLLHEWQSSRKHGVMLLSCMLAIMCAMLKIPGLLMTGIWLLALVTCQIDFSRRWVLIAVAVSAAIVSMSLTIGVELPNLFTLSWEEIETPYIGTYALKFNDVFFPVFDTTLIMINWNFLFYAVPLLLMLVVPSVRKKIFSTGISPPTIALLLTLTFLSIVYFFTERYKFAVDYTQINRALLYAVPLTIYCFFNLIYLASGSRENPARSVT
ncbi:hypothetical protein EYC87_18495 [Halieaceae bacterium IMCC8485]|uniref:Glycosyltransferase RgtA/B/C/D-like domain-containing protein n=1 Tax=Candidatus Seongchinamella marina TaxID=2518990 RepID=A0ABT3T130_9GAMM|nr:hypothetical protein [Candidatus Seongchinamella marina]MCX2975575.1 hypothetical protein [Candidatus Seongchinamella marina]